MDTSAEESGETRPPEEVLGDQSNAVVAIVIKPKKLVFCSLFSYQTFDQTWRETTKKPEIERGGAFQ